MAAADRLSDLSDDMLTHILSFVPTREAARSTVLSHRWRRPLWLDAPALTIDSRSYPAAATVFDHCPQWHARTDVNHALAFLHSARDGAGRGPSKVALVMRDKAVMLHNVLPCFDDGADELRVDCFDPARSLSLGSLPSIGTLRILDLAGCDLPAPSSDAWSFPCLEALRLRRCGRIDLNYHLQDMIHAAPMLADLRLQSLVFPYSGIRLHCPTVTALVMTNCHVDDLVKSTIEVDAPRLRRLRYRYTRINASVSLASPPQPNLELVDLEVHSAAHLRTMLRSASSRKKKRAAIKVLKLTVYSIADIASAVDGMVFRNLEHLQIEQVCGCLDDRAAAAAAMANMLRVCPVVRELRLKFSWRKYLHESSDVDPELMARLDIASDYCSSMDGDGAIAACCEVPDAFRCGCTLDRLRSVVVQLEAKQLKLTCFQVQLLNFLARNSVLLEKVRVDGGDHRDDSSREVARWTMASLGKRKSCQLCCRCAPPAAAAVTSSAPHRPAAPAMSSFPPLRPRRRRAVPFAALLLPVRRRRPTRPAQSTR